jgi:hypothetical protein
MAVPATVMKSKLQVPYFFFLRQLSFVFDCGIIMTFLALCDRIALNPDVVPLPIAAFDCDFKPLDTVKPCI